MGAQSALPPQAKRETMVHVAHLAGCTRMDVEDYDVDRDSDGTRRVTLALRDKNMEIQQVRLSYVSVEDAYTLFSDSATVETIFTDNGEFMYVFLNGSMYAPETD